jgi:HYR domain-containing protein
MRWLPLLLFLLPFGVAHAAPAVTLPTDMTLIGEFEPVACTGGPPSALCFVVDESGLWPGLGRVELHELVVQSGLTDADLCEPQTRHGTFTATGGTISYVANGIDCPATRMLLGGYRAVVADWVITAGTGRFEGVTGSGRQNVRPEDEGDEVNTHYQGALSVPGAAFDTTKPVFSGVRRVTVRARTSTVVRYRLPTAADAVDGPLPVRCLPRSGARFAVGRTPVWCTAVDDSGNEAVAVFTVEVRRP